MYFKVLVIGLALASLAATSAFAQPSPGAPASTPPAAASPAPPILPFDEALQKAANDLLKKAAFGDAEKAVLVIDPLIDGVTGAQSVATRGMERKIVEIVNKSYPKFQVEKFSTSAIAKSPIVLIGTFTLINN